MIHEELHALTGLTLGDLFALFAKYGLPDAVFKLWPHLMKGLSDWIRKGCPAKQPMPHKMTFLLFLCFALDMHPSWAQINYRIIDKQEAPGLASYSLVIPVDEFKKESLLRLSNQFLHRYEKLKLLNVGIYTDNTTASNSAGKGKFDFTYGVWKSEFEARKQKNSLRVAALLKYGDSASLRIRYSESGLLARVLSVLSRSTALQFRRAGLASEVTYENEKIWQL